VLNKKRVESDLVVQMFNASETPESVAVMAIT